MSGGYFKTIFKCVLKAEFIFVLMLLIKFLWLYYHKNTLDIEYVQMFQPLSLINLLDYQTVPKWLTYPLQVFNLFEVGYWLLLAFYFSREMNKSFAKSFEFVLSSYGAGLIIWVVFVSFLMLNLA